MADTGGTVDLDHLRSALHKAFGRSGEMNQYWSAWAHSALTADELAAVAEMGIRPQEGTRSAVVGVLPPGPHDRERKANPDEYVQLPSARDELEHIVDEAEAGKSFVIMAHGRDAAVLIGYAEHVRLISRLGRADG